MKTVLIVDDHPDSVALARHVLSRERLECTTAADGELVPFLLVHKSDVRVVIPQA